MKLELLFEILMSTKTIHEPTRNVFSCPFLVISWIVLAQGERQHETNLGH
jgi:hypothetical protein